MNILEPAAVIGTNSWGSAAYGVMVRGSYVNDDVIRSAMHTADKCNLKIYDLARDYGFGKAQKMIGEFGTEDIFISAKYTPFSGYKKGCVRKSLEKDLNDFRRDHVDIYWLHLPTDIEPHLKEIIELVREGKIRYVGVSNFDLEECRLAKRILENAGLKLYGVQGRCKDNGTRSVPSVCKKIKGETAMNEQKPIQKRAVETRNKIMNAAFDMYGKQGYYRTTVDEIAAEAGVSTGIAYRYFRNKKDLLICTLNYLAENIKSLSGTENISADAFKNADVLSSVIEKFEQLHRKYYAFHEELEGLRHTDKDVKKLYDDFEKTALTGLADGIKGSEADKFPERLHMAVSLIEAYCHTVTDSRYNDLDRDFLRHRTIDAVLGIMGD